jgi:hypothetical protein
MEFSVPMFLIYPAKCHCVFLIRVHPGPDPVLTDSWSITRAYASASAFVTCRPEVPIRNMNAHNRHRELPEGTTTDPREPVVWATNVDGSETRTPRNPTRAMITYGRVRR